MNNQFQTKVLLIYLLFLLPSLAIAQDCLGKIQAARKEKDSGNYRSALKKYYAAAADCGAGKSLEIQQDVEEIYDRIESLRREAKKAEEKAKKEAKKAYLATEKADEEKERNEKLIERFIPYRGNLAWVYKVDSNAQKVKFALINKNGDLITDYAFENPGFLGNYFYANDGIKNRLV